MTNDDPHDVTTDEERERFHLARRRGGTCAACGRTLAPDEPVWVERFAIGPVGHGRTGRAYGAVGAECASSESRHRAQARESERCAGCGRSMYYRVADPRRRQALCSRTCANLASAARRRKAEG